MFLKNLYGKVGVWRSRSEIAGHLANSCVVYKDNGLLVINKPFNLGYSQGSDISLRDVIPELQRILRLPFLDYISSPEKFATGLLLLGTDPESKKRVILSRERSLTAGHLYQSYFTITDGIPHLSNKATFETIDSFQHKYPDSKEVEPVLTRKLFSKQKLLAPNSPYKRYHVYTETLSRSSQNGVDSALVAISPSSLRNHFVQLYMADLLSPLLGDILYSYRVRRINGVPTRVSHVNAPPDKTQKLSPGMLGSLGLRSGEEDIIPKHLHRFRVVLKRFLGKNKDLVLVAEPPEYFMATASALGLNMDAIQSWNKEHFKQKLIKSN